MRMMNGGRVPDRRSSIRTWVSRMREWVCPNTSWIILLLVVPLLSCGDTINPLDPSSYKPAFTARSTAGTVQITPDRPLLVKLRSTLQLSARVEDADGNEITTPVTWSIRPTYVASLSAEGLLTSKRAGDATITATARHGGATLTGTASLRSRLVRGFKIVPRIHTVLLAPDSVQMKAIVLDRKRDTIPDIPHSAFTWTSSATDVATVDSAGFVWISKRGYADITVTLGPLEATSFVTRPLDRPGSQPPEVARKFADLEMVIGDTARTFLLNDYFDDPDAGDTLTFSAASMHGFVSASVVEDTILSISPDSAGVDTVTVQAGDQTYQRVSQSFQVAVDTAPLPPPPIIRGGSEFRLSVRSRFYPGSRYRDQLYAPFTRWSTRHRTASGLVGVGRSGYGHLHVPGEYRPIYADLQGPRR